MPNQKNPPFDEFSTALDFDSYRHYTRQGFNLMQNWCANLVLQKETQNQDAVIVSMVKPMHSNPIVVDQFLFVADELFPLFMILVFLMPIYRFTSWIVSEK